MNIVLLLASLLVSPLFASRVLNSAPYSWLHIVRFNTIANAGVGGYEKFFLVSVRNTTNTAQTVTIKLSANNINIIGNPPAHDNYTTTMNGSTFTGGSTSATTTLNLGVPGSGTETQNTTFIIQYKFIDFDYTGGQGYNVYGTISPTLTVAEDSGAVTASLTESVHCQGGCMYADENGAPPEQKYFNLIGAIQANTPRFFEFNQGRPF